MSSILVIVNDPLLRFAIVSYLKLKGHSPIEVPDARTAVNLARTGAIEAVLLDVHPVSERVALLEELRSHPGLKHVPVIALICSQGRLESLGRLGPIEFLELPFEMPMLTWTLENLLAERRFPQGVQLSVAVG